MPAYLRLIVEAYNEAQEAKERKEWQRMAWFTSILLAPHTKKGRVIDYEKLLPESMREKKEPMTKEEAKRELEELKKDLKIK